MIGYGADILEAVRRETIHVAMRLEPHPAVHHRHDDRLIHDHALRADDRAVEERGDVVRMHANAAMARDSIDALRRVGAVDADAGK